MESTSRFSLAIAVGAVCALLAVHFGDAARWPVLFGVGGLAFWALREPATGLLASLPLVFMIHPTPTEPGWREFGFVIVLAIGGSASLWQKRSVLPGFAREVWWVILGAGTVLGANIATAASHGVPTSDWMRGAIPFVFVLSLIPVFLEARSNEVFKAAWLWAAIVTAGLFSWHVVSYFVSEQLWNPYSYTFDNGTWTRLDGNTLKTTVAPVFEFKARVTQLVQQATDAFLPLGYVWGVWLVLWGRSQVIRSAGFALVILSIVAMILTYTRSMLLAAWAVGGLLMLFAAFAGAWRKVVIAALITVFTASATVAVFDLEDVYLNRIFLLRQALNAVTEKQATSSGQEAPHEERGGQAGVLPGNTVNDANVNSRMEEYQTAWSMFLESPILGQGLGIRHTISFETGHGEMLTVSVGYVHNWIFYVLMVGGGVGLLAYSLILFGPAVLVFRSLADDREQALAIIATVIALALYACFFAVFRLISFNLLLGGLWGLALAMRQDQKAVELRA
ncbi:MAG: O-antigen ligase family protein [Candidatus Accumulibacter meliphilus]|jgi:hypothetical protein|uniref:O-antigen ligase family protein n=1 Tax=Candidatus Accumulibacter meliphilus TaxID=2211374 RepID=UPI002FC31A7B